MPCFTTTTTTTKRPRPRTSKSSKSPKSSISPLAPSMTLNSSHKTVKATRVFGYKKDGRRFTAGHCIETEIHAMNGSYPCPVGSRRVPAISHSESEVFSKRTDHDPVPGLPQGYQSVESTVQRAWYRGDLNTWEARWDYTHDIAYRSPQVWDKCFDGYWAFKEDLKQHKQEWKQVKEDWRQATQTWKQRLGSSSDITRAFHRMRG